MGYELMSKEGLIRYVHTLKAERDALRKAIKKAIRTDFEGHTAGSVSVMGALSKALEGGE